MKKKSLAILHFSLELPDRQPLKFHIKVFFQSFTHEVVFNIIQKISFFDDCDASHSLYSYPFGKVKNYVHTFINHIDKFQPRHGEDKQKKDEIYFTNNTLICCIRLQCILAKTYK